MVVLSPNMEDELELQKRFQESANAFLDSWKAMDDFDKRVWDHEPTTVESVKALFRFGDMFVKMIIAIRDGDAWLRGN